MNKRKASFAIRPDEHVDSGFCSDIAQPVPLYHLLQPYDPTSVSPAPKKQLIEAMINEDRVETAKHPADGHRWLNTREPLSESSNINVRNDPTDSPLTRYGKRADHDIIVNFIKTANIEENFLRDYNRLRQFGEINIPRRKDLITLLQKYPVIAKQSLILTLVKDIARLDETLDIFKDANITLTDENDMLVEENEMLTEKIEDMIYNGEDEDDGEEDG